MVFRSRSINPVQTHLPVQTLQASPPSSSSVEPPPTQTPQNPQPTHDEALRKSIIQILAANANGCIAELGYETLRRHYENTVPRYNKLVEEKKALQAENKALKYEIYQLSRMIKENTSNGGNNQQNVQALQARIAQQEKEIERLRTHCNILQQSLSLNATDAYKLLQNKYNYLLEFIKRCNMTFPSSDPSVSESFLGSIIGLH